jgi:Kef-type K+ transport system membrane component KefB
MRRPATWIPFVLVASCAATGEAHADPVGPLLWMLAAVLVAAKVGGALASRLGQPSVLGELLAGVVLGALHHAGLPLPDLAGDATLDMLARLGVVVLLFEVGLESTVPQLLSVGLRASVIAIVGVAAPIAAGLALGPWLMPGGPWSKHLFVGAALCATSVGITARVFKDLGLSQSPEARLIVGAAVIDDVLGLVVLSVVTGMAVASSSGAPLEWAVPLRSAGLAALFLAGAVLLGPRISRLMFLASARLRTPDLLLPVALVIAFVLAAVAGNVQLAPIVGAYAAGLVLEPAHYRTLTDRGEHELEQLVRPVGQLLVPVFFVLMGARVQIWEFTGLRVWGVAAALVLIAVVTKLVCALAAPKGVSRLAVGLGMIPRGEVGLIFADAGRQLVVGGRPLLGASDFSALVLMVALTTLVTPPLLGRALRGAASPSASGG